MKTRAWSVLAIAIITLALLASACGGGKATISTTSTTTSAPPTTSTTGAPPSTTTTTPPTSTTSTGGTLSLVAIPITTHNAAQMASYKGLCQMCHGPGTTNSNPYPPTWDGKANGSTANTGVYTITPGSTQDHTAYTVDECTKAGCHAAEGVTNPPTSTTTTPTVSTTTTPPASTTTTPPGSTTPTSTVLSGLQFVGITTSGFEPPTMTARVGTSVTFTNRLEGDTFLTCDALEVDQPILKGKDFTYTFKAAGSYTFLDDEGHLWKITIV